MRGLPCPLEALSSRIHDVTRGFQPFRNRKRTSLARRQTVVGIAFGAGHREARDRDLLATPGIPSVLGVEKQARHTWEVAGVSGGARSDSQDEPSESALGSTSDSR